MLSFRHGLFALTLLTAAATAADAPAALQSGALAPRLATDGGTFALAVKANPERVPLNEPFEMTVDVSLQRTVDDPNPLWLGLEATMPSHSHGMNTRAQVEPLANGRFVVKGLLFHMAGEWEVVFQVAKGRIHEQARTRVLIE